MFTKHLPLLFAALCATASAATYQLSISNTIDSVYDSDTESDFANTPYGLFASGSTLTLTLTYDIDDLVQDQTAAWPGGSGAEYRSSTPAVLNITVSSGYSYSGTLGGGSAAWFSLYNQITAHDQGNYLDEYGNPFVQFNDEYYSSGSITFTNEQIPALSVADAHSLFAAGVNSGTMTLANGLPGRLPGMSYSVYTNTSSLPTVSLLPVTAVPEPSHGLLAATALIGLFARRRRAAAAV